MTREEIIATATRIAEIRRYLEQVPPLQKELRALEAKLDGLVDSASPISSPISSADKFPLHLGDSLTEKAIRVIDSDRQRVWTGDDVNKELNANLNSVHAALSKAFNTGRIEKSGRGKFRAKFATQENVEVKSESQEGLALTA